MPTQAGREAWLSHERRRGSCSVVILMRMNMKSTLQHSRVYFSLYPRARSCFNASICSGLGSASTLPRFCLLLGCAPLDGDSCASSGTTRFGAACNGLSLPPRPSGAGPGVKSNPPGPPSTGRVGVIGGSTGVADRGGPTPVQWDGVEWTWVSANHCAESLNCARLQ